MDENTGTGFFPGLILGALVGAAVALLCAPQTGADTRKLVKEKASEIRDKAVDAICQLKESPGSIGKGEA